ncbi:MAG: c-type cytochrome [Persicimonas sp.]
MMQRRAILLVGLLLLCSCSSADEPAPAEQEESSLDFPWNGEGQGKTDAFGRSLVGAPNPYTPDPELLDDPAAAQTALSGDMRQRREVAWQTAHKVLEPVPLAGLSNQLDARPACDDSVENRELDRCSDQPDPDTCASFESASGFEICAWDDEDTRCEPVCDHLTLPDGQEIPEIPRWETWYGVEDINRIFKYAYSRLDEDQKLARAPLDDELIGQAFQYNNTAQERSSRWPLRRYTDSVIDLFGCGVDRLPGEADEDYAQRCAQSRQSAFSGSSAAGGGVARMMYSPAMVLHLMRNYGEVLACRDTSATDSWCGDGQACDDPSENFSTCFRAEFPADAGHPWRDADSDEEDPLAGLPGAEGTVLIKATWARVGFGFDLPAYDTDADALRERIGPGALARWPDEGDRLYESPEDPQEQAFPTPDDIYTIQTRSDGVYRLTGLHIMTKELRHWQWVSLWWSDDPDTDFGADRPDSFDDLPPVWSNYKMCAVVDYLEADADAPGRFEDLPSLQAALEAIGSEPGAPSWCSNPYIEHEAGNARTNCIGCHQHAGTRFKESFEEGRQPEFDLQEVIANASPTLDRTNRYPANGRTRRRTHFPSDYSWAFSRLDDLTELIRTEVEYSGAQDERWLRIRDILAAEGSATAGRELFLGTTETQACADCHGEQGEGDFGPNLSQRFSQKTEWQLLYTIIDGRAEMPAWGEELTDEELADLFSYLRADFAPE